ncbi:MAG: aldehyde dehydrogenase family protein, partial [Solirubrobacterales bacterium]
MEPTIAPQAPRHAFSEATAPSGTLESFNPATGKLVGSVPTITPDQVPAVVEEIKQVQPFWAELSFEDRARYVRRAADVLIERKDEIAALVTAE